ncbi:MAG: TIGR04255 family protein [Phycisphaerae bacterium]
MNERRHYSRAPISQALIDVQVAAARPLDLAKLALLPPQIAGDFQQLTPLFVGNAFLDMQAGQPARFDARQVGYSMQGRGSYRYALQARTDGLTVSRMEPYEKWENLRDEFMRIWGWYRGVVEPDGVTRLAVRYINIIDLPLPFGDFKEYLRTTPEIGGGLPAGLSGFAMQLQIPQPDLPGMIIFNEALAPPRKPNVASVILDIDVFQTQKVPLAFEDRLEILHNIENSFFERSITDEFRELIT